MKVSELRIGNFADYHGEIVELKTGAEIDGCAILNPIPLTEEWLLKFDLVPHSKKYNGDIRCKLHDDRFEISLYHDDKDCKVLFEGNDLTYIQYVHQLQNLYFALTGEELTIRA